MRSFFEGNDMYGRTHHTVQYFDGQRVRESSVYCWKGEIAWAERTIPGILQVGIRFQTAKRRLAAYEERCTRRIG